MRKRGYPWFKLAVASILVVAVAVAGCSVPQTSSDPAAGLAVSSAPGGAPQEGIKVHGHWTVEVTNPDGTLAERREFDNALVSSASWAKIFARQMSFGGWEIELMQPAGEASAFFNSFGDSVSGYIFESTYSLQNDPYVFKNLTLSLAQGGFVLSGTATAQRAGRIGMVRTIASELAATLPPSDTYARTSAFTSATLLAPISVGTGQQIAATVVITLS